MAKGGVGMPVWENRPSYSRSCAAASARWVGAESHGLLLSEPPPGTFSVEGHHPTLSQLPEPGFAVVIALISGDCPAIARRSIDNGTADPAGSRQASASVPLRAADDADVHGCGFRDRFGQHGAVCRSRNVRGGASRDGGYLAAEQRGGQQRMLIVKVC